MSARITLNDFLRHVEGVYKTLDIRIAAVKHNDAWQNALTVIRFSCMENRDIKNQQEQLASKWKPVDTESFRVEMFSWSFKSLNVLCREYLKQGKMACTGGIGSVQIGRIIDLFSLQGDFEGYGYTKREAEPYPLFEIIDGSHCALLQEEQLQNEVKSKTLVDPYSLIRELLEVDFHRNLNFDIAVSAPFYAHIEHWDFGEQRCKVQVKFNKDIRGLAISAIVRRGNSNEAPLRDRAHSTISLEESEELGEYFRLWRKELDLLNATPNDYLSVSLIQTVPKALDIHTPSYSTQIKQILESKRPENEPLLAAFRRFCSLDELEKYLNNPEKATPFNRSKKDASATFELAMGWLLSLCGFEVIWMGQTKHEFMQEGTVKRLSVDILAYYEAENNLLLVGCTVGIPNDKDVDNVKSLRKVLLEEVFEGTQIQVSSFVFSAVPELSNKARDGVHVLDRDDIRGILNYVREEDIPRALSTYFNFNFRPRRSLRGCSSTYEG